MRGSIRRADTGSKSAGAIRALGQPTIETWWVGSRLGALRFRGSHERKIIFCVNSTIRHLPNTHGIRWHYIWITPCHRPMKTEEAIGSRLLRDNVTTVPVVVHVIDHDFQREVLEKLGRLEANVEMLVGDGQPGRMKIAEDKIFALQRNDIRRSVYDRIVNAVIATAISIVVALHDHLGLR